MSRAAAVVGPGRVAATAGLIPGAVVDVVLIAGRRRAAALPPGAGIDVILVRGRRRRPWAAAWRAPNPPPAKPPPIPGAARTGSSAPRQRPCRRRHPRRLSAPTRGNRSRRAAGTCPADSSADIAAAGALPAGNTAAAAGRRLARPAAAAPPRIALRRALAAAGCPAAEQPAEESAARLAGRLLAVASLLRRLLGLLQFPLQPLDAVLRLGEGMFLHEGKLGDAIAGFGILVECLARSTRRRPGRPAAVPAGSRDRAGGKPDCWRGAADPGDKLADDVAFFVRHGVPPMGLSERPERAECGADRHSVQWWGSYRPW